MSSSGSVAELPLAPKSASESIESSNNSYNNDNHPDSSKENGAIPESADAGSSNDKPTSATPPRPGLKPSRRNSLELRKLPVNVLLAPEESRLFDEELSCDDGESDGETYGGRNLLQRTCLNSKFTLRMQMLLSFGVISASTILLVIIVCIAVSLFAGEVVKEETRTTFNEVSQALEAKMTRYIAEDLTPRLLMEDVVQLLYEVTLDRFLGYPNDDDSTVPYFDILTQSNKYPIRGKPLPLDWQIEANVNAENAAEHVQGRLGHWNEGAKISTVNAAYFMQGMCDPSATDATQITYLEGCTDENNNITSGGVYAPSPTNEQIHRKAADIVPILKSLHEYHQELRAVAVFFSNSGAGSTVTYPGTQIDGTSEYISIGCEYLKGPHPLDNSRSILSDEDVERCRGNGVRVENATIPRRLYSPLDRGWCQNQILNPGKVVTTGPFLDAWTGKLWVMSVGRAIYDPVTKELIACTNLDLDVETAMSDILKGSRVTSNSQVTVVRWNGEGTVVSSSAWNMRNSTKTVAVSSLNVGVSVEAYDEFYNLVDYSTIWNPSEVQQKYEEFVIIDSGFQVKAYPMPPIPEEYDPTYEPTFLVLFSVSEADIFVFADRVDSEVDEKVTLLIILSVSVGLAGLGAVLAVLVAVSNHVTRPLRNMDETAVRIINNFGGDAKIEVQDSTKETNGWVKTELSEIVYEFQRMVRKFSGGAMARAAKACISEVHNRFDLFDDFQELYSSRLAGGLKYNIEVPRREAKEEVSVANRVHCGSNILSGSASTVKNSTGQARLLSGNRGATFSSPLFKWIVVLIVLPLLLSTITISTAVIATVSKGLPGMIKIAEAGLIDVQVEGLAAFASLRAGYVSRSSEQSIRDLHVTTRYASWLLFGALDIVAFPELLAGTDYCKQYSSELEECPYFLENHVCDCAWNDDDGPLPCDTYANASVHSRYLQSSYFVSSSEDVDENGNRMSTSFPELAYSPETTSWWRNQSEVPGSPSTEASQNFTVASVSKFGYETTYQRLRSAAASPVYVPLYNYDLLKETVLGAFTFFEADGSSLSYRGCRNMYHASSSNFRSTVANGAARLRPELCPLDKYGYDGRCRGWYDSGRQHYLATGEELYVTPPYVFAGSGRIGQSCTAPLFDPETKEHLGQILIDFVSTNIFKSLDDEHTPLVKDGFHLLITMEEDVYNADVVIGPGLSISDPARPLKEVVNAQNNSCDKELCGFDEVARAMKAGEKGRNTFVLDDGKGNSVTYHIAFSPVIVKSLKQVDASQFSNGVILAEYKLYSIALAEPEASILESFEDAEDDINGVMHIGLGILVTLIVLATGLVVVLSHRIVVSMTEPMYYLLELIRNINRLDVDEDPPDENLHGGYGSSEVLNVRMTMEKLYKIIQCANAAYFAGETEFAYEVFKDALQMFERLDNKKAMGVTANNLGNTMLTLYRTMQVTGDDMVCGMTRRQIIGKGMAYFHQAIQLGEEAYDAFYEAEGWSPKCLHFMQHLSNRYFNRAMFLLTVKDDHEKPKEIEELGWRDIQIARDMDVEIVDEGTQVGWGVRSADAQLEVLLCRIRGHVTLLEMSYPDDWDVDEMLDNAFKILKTEIKKESSDLFVDVGPACRMQQIEFLLIRYFRVKGDLETAAKISIRMLVEDEFTLPDAQQKAVETMIAYAEAKNMSPSLQKQLQSYSEWLRDTVDELDTQRSSKDAIENTRNSFVSSNMALSMRLLEIEKSNPNSVASLRESMRGDVVMESF